MVLSKLFLACLTAQAFALPATNDIHRDSIRHQTLYGKRDGPSGHGGEAAPGGMAGMSHGGGEAKPAMAGMSGGGMGGGLSDFFLQSSMNQPLLNTFIGVLPTMPMTKKDLDMPSTFKRPGAKKANLVFGPYEIVDAVTRKKTPNKNIIAMDPGGTTFMNKVTNFPSDISLLDAVVKLIYEDGSPATVDNGIYNHHIAFQDTSKKPPAMVACPGQAAKNSVPTSVFVATGEDGNSYHYAPDLPDFDSGYYIGPNDGIGVFAEIVNYTNQTKKIFASVDYNYVPGKPKFDVSGATLSVTQCDGAQVGIKPQKGQKIFAVNSKEMKVEMDGYIFAVRGHLHDGGDYVGITVNGKSTCESKGVYNGGKGSLTDMTVCQEPIPVKKGDMLVITAKYDLEAHPPRELGADGGEAEEMGLAMFSFAALNPSSSSSSPSGGVTGVITSGMSAIMPPFMTPSFWSPSGALAANSPPPAAYTPKSIPAASAPARPAPPASPPAAAPPAPAPEMGTMKSMPGHGY